jgi:hypothetical protein
MIILTLQVRKTKVQMIKQVHTVKSWALRQGDSNPFS